MGNLNGIRTELKEVWSRLRLRWTETLSVWDDPVSRRFERQFWESLESEVSSTQAKLEQLISVIDQAKRNVY